MARRTRRSTCAALALLTRSLERAWLSCRLERHLLQPLGKRPRARAVECFALVILVAASDGCAAHVPPHDRPTPDVHESVTSVILEGRSLQLHLSAPRGDATGDILVLYASGDGGWFGTAVDMFRRVGHAGYYAVGFSAKDLLKLERPANASIDPAQLATEYRQILARARDVMHLRADMPAVLTGWSRGASFAVLAGSEAGAPANLRGVVAIGLGDREDFTADSPADASDDDTLARGDVGQGAFEPYQRIVRLGSTPCAVIQASGDGYLPAQRAHELFGPDTQARRFYAIDARNHRFSGGRDAFDRAWLDALHWISSESPR